MRIILFRHGPAGKRDPDRWQDDGDRPLTPRGIERTTRAARGLATLEPGITHVITSPLVRASETARLLGEAVGEGIKVETLDTLAPGRSPRAVLQHVARLPEDAVAVLVGHEPDLGQLAGVLASQQAGAVTLKKAGACAIAFESGVRAGGGVLQWLVPPRMLRKRAKVKR